MKNYKKSSYAANKYSRDIVYRSEVSEDTSVTLEDFLKSDPNLTEKDFLYWKKWSDENYLDEVRSENKLSKKSVNISGIENCIDPSEKTVEDVIEEKTIEPLEKQAVRLALILLYEDTSFTEKMRMRFEMHYFGGLSFEEIAKEMNVGGYSVRYSVEAALKKFTKYLKEAYKQVGIESN